MKRAGPFLIYVGPLLAWMAFIFVMSSGIGEGDNTRGLIARIISFFAPGVIGSLSAEDLAALNYAVRKAGHVTEYFILMLLAVRAIRFGRMRLERRSLALALPFCALYAAGDEFHQSFVAGRSASIVDVGIDIIGALLGMALIGVWSRFKSRERPSRKPEAVIGPASRAEAGKP
jgi:VanZ family protein